MQNLNNRSIGLSGLKLHTMQLRCHGFSFLCYKPPVLMVWHVGMSAWDGREWMSMERFTILPTSQDFMSNWFLRWSILSAPLTKKKQQLILLGCVWTAYCCVRSQAEKALCGELVVNVSHVPCWSGVGPGPHTCKLATCSGEFFG